ncbi:sterol 3-beta-glucosyltransferase UGT80B1 [Carex littledalei]|uniref:Sterol 3-beta-glucosyltransferase UGT80B1 n=1 Tax=Carex littledalei TaxID=544730 RepID=A0A833QYL2_9POAL|nr:sterol 3-beta-glucosyltransferase UGT80B1 [Carex littledalei]
MARNDEIEVLNECEGIEESEGKKELGERPSAAGSSPELVGIADFIVRSLDEKFSGSAESDSELYSSPQPVLGHCNTAPARPSSLSQSSRSHELTGTERRGVLKVDLTLDKLPEKEKKKIIENLVRIQQDGTVDVDVTSGFNVSELLELDAVGSSPFAFNVKEEASEYNKSVPRLNVAMLVVGTRGDVQPFIAFAKRLQEFGHNVRLATHVNFRKFVKSAGVDFYPLGGDPKIMAAYMARTKGFLLSGPTEISTQRKQLKEIIYSLLPACTEPDLDTGAPFHAQAIIANPPAYGRPTNEFPHPFARVPQSAAYRLSYLIVDLVVWWGIRGYINEFRKKKLKLPPIAYFSTYHGSISHLPTAYMWSPQLVPKPADWGSLVDVVGYCFLNLGPKYQPPRELVEWIEQGSQPIYIGFGSIPLDDEKNIMAIILEALKETGQRGIIGRGWGSLGSLSEIPVDVYLLDDCPHDWLFPRCTAVVHHGGAGTTATGLRAGCPTTIIPFFGDQFFWGDRIHAEGVGPAPIPISELTVERLCSALKFMLEPEVKLRAMELAREIENEEGVANAVNAFHRHLPAEIPIAPPETPDLEPPNPFEYLCQVFERWCCLPLAP